MVCDFRLWRYLSWWAGDMRAMVSACRASDNYFMYEFELVNGNAV